MQNFKLYILNDVRPSEMTSFNEFRCFLILQPAEKCLRIQLQNVKYSSKIYHRFAKQ